MKTLTTGSEIQSWRRRAFNSSSFIICNKLTASCKKPLTNKTMNTRMASYAHLKLELVNCRLISHVLHFHAFHFLQIIA